MKTRNGFVSNSSSSSFLIAYHAKDDFGKFSQFDGYADLIGLLGRDSESNALEHISTVISSYLSCIADKCSDYITGTEMASDFSSSEYYDLIYRLEIPDEITSPVEEYSKAMWDYAEEVKSSSEMPDRTQDHKGYWKCVDEIREKMSRKSGEILDGVRGVKEIPGKILDYIKSKGYVVSCVEFGDDSDYGSYMEHEFMPFLSSAPRADFRIHTLNLH